MAEFSVIIVNYNVKYFLAQCLHAVRRAAQGEQVEVIVVDNASADGSSKYIRDHFPDCLLIELDKNIGFSTANNKGAALASGTYLLFLNPDTIVPETIFKEIRLFIQQHSDAGAVGFRMVDGAGVYLDESKRGKPTIWAGFCKFSGLSALFSSKKLFSGYYLGYLSTTSEQQIDVVSGAAFVVKKKIFDEIKGFDEDFFMYGEDIDLSLRVIAAGYRNYYYPGFTVLHFKGESTAKNKEYYHNFYSSMSIFIRKHRNIGLNYAFYPLFRLFLPILWRIPLFYHSLKNRLKPAVQVAADLPANTRIRYVNGNYTYAAFIHDLEREGPLYITAEGSGSLVGSVSKQTRGFAIPWPPAN